MKIAIELSDDRVEGLRAFGADFSRWHLGGREVPDELALLICVLYTAVGPENPNEVGASGAEPVEIDMPDLIRAAEQWLNAHK